MTALQTFLKTEADKYKEYKKRKNQEAMDALVEKFTDLAYDAIFFRYCGE